jgi:crotonobetainyl-CoA:carnitine CoA-transferase CaiB-like acyl-CoA transferase
LAFNICPTSIAPHLLVEVPDGALSLHAINSNTATIRPPWHKKSAWRVNPWLALACAGDAAISDPPLAGFRVLDLTNVLAGPFCAYQLALLGAEVIKVERPDGGDLARQLGADDALNAAGMGASFLAQNAGKRSITVDLKQAEGRAVLERLLATADVLVENFRPGVMARLGLGHAALEERHPRLVYAAISGFGQDGPLRDKPAYDQIVQGLSGLMSVTGDASSAPLRAGTPIADTVGGLVAAFAITAALLRRERHGRGAMVDVAMLDSLLTTMGWVVSNYLIAGQAPRPMGNDNMTASPSGAFRTSAGLLNIAANQQVQFERLCAVVGLPELVSDPRFARRAARKAHRAALTALLEQALAARPAAEWAALLTAAGVPAGEVLTVPEVLDHPQIAARKLLNELPAPEGLERSIAVLNAGFRLDGAPLAVDRPPPALGQDTDALLAELGYGEAEIAALRACGAV